MQIHAKAVEMFARMNDFQLFEMAELIDDYHKEHPDREDIWLTRAWFFDEIDKRGMLVFNPDRDDFDIVVNGTHYDSITFEWIGREYSLEYRLGFDTI
ncbi:MAG: hypothetical protein WBA46_00180 [Thermomicrobiales bacterium]